MLLYNHVFQTIVYLRILIANRNFWGGGGLLEGGAYFSFKRGGVRLLSGLRCALFEIHISLRNASWGRVRWKPILRAFTIDNGEDFKCSIHKVFCHRFVELIHLCIVESNICDIELIGFVSTVHYRVCFSKVV